MIKLSISRLALKALRVAFFSYTWVAACSASAQSTGDPLRLLVGFPPGGGTDAIARVLAEKLGEELGKPVVVDNRAGAGGQIAAQILKSAPADGRTFFLSNDHTISIVPQVMKNPGFDPPKDFVPVAGFANSINGLAVPATSPVRTVAEYVAWVKRQNGACNAVGIPAPASIPEFLVRDIGAKYQLDLQAVPYRGSGPMIVDMLSNQIPAGIGSVADFIEYHKAGKIRLIALIGRERQTLFPDVQTFSELGMTGLEDLPYYGFFAPRGTPQAAMDRFGAALAKVVATPAVHDRITAMGFLVEFTNQGQFTERVRVYTTQWAQTIKASGYQPQ
ncbi:Bug family tripartite tricarboxylate transporter substrate binding protein [Variovorax paradoxus]|nr:Bug family tripartite tricarboxylate transporter substrate binding protein [Variovorax paradoxus]WPH18095.1 Bug family tripartite tricarboxylate transporter substrate binding protein [Variovorax paradoxus]